MLYLPGTIFAHQVIFCINRLCQHWASTTIMELSLKDPSYLQRISICQQCRFASRPLNHSVGAKSLQAISWIQFIENRCHLHQKKWIQQDQQPKRSLSFEVCLKNQHLASLLSLPSHPWRPKWLGLNVAASSKVSYHPSWSLSQKLTTELVGWGQIFWVRDTPPKTKIDISHDGLEKVTPASNMGHFFVSRVKFLGCIHNIHGTKGIFTF